MLIVYVQGKFTGQEVEMRVEGTVDGEPVRAIVHYIPSKQVRVHASYRSEDYFSLSFTTQLQDFLTGTIGVSAWASFCAIIDSEDSTYPFHLQKLLSFVKIFPNEGI